MRIKNIQLNNFRNYERLDLKVGPSLNIFYGENAQGKTNIIESVTVCTSITSNKPVHDRELIKIGQNEYSIKLDIDDDNNNPLSLAVEYFDENSEISGVSTAKRNLFVDGIEVKRISDYIGICNTVIFAPEDLNIVKGSPNNRRKFFNCLISKVSPSYLNVLGQFNRINNQKNNALKKMRMNGINDAELDYYDFSIADLSAEIIITRYRFALLLSRYARDFHSAISDGNEDLEVTYNTITGSIELLKAFLEENNIVDEFIERGPNRANFERIKGIVSSHILAKIKAARQSDAERGISSIGINKDDLDLLLSGLQMKKYSSQGQQRSASLSLKMAELEIVKKYTSSMPILLLDDVLSELDVNRRVRLLSGVTTAQIFITCTDRSYIENELNSLLTNHPDPHFFHVVNGEIFPENT